MADPTPTTSAERGQDAFPPLRCPKCHLAFEGAEGQTLESLAAECGIGHHTDTADGCPMDAVPPSAERVAALEAVAEAARFVTPTAQLHRYADLAAALATLDAT